MRDRKGSVPELLLIYVSVLGILALIVGYGFTKVTVASEEATRRSEQEKTVLAERIESAREIRRALARPVPPPDPLPPVTAKLAHQLEEPQQKLAATGTTKDKPRKLKIPAAARNAMAMKTGGDAPSHQRRQASDHGGLNGW